MEKGIPDWAREMATPQDRRRAIAAYRRWTWQITWPERRAVRAWAKRQGWPAPWFIFDGRFIDKMLESDENFALALEEGGIQVSLPLDYYEISDEKLKALDALYEEREEMGALGMRPVGWGSLVGELREIRRAVEADVMIAIDDRKIKSVGSFLTWAHGRYPLLEDGYDSWIGDDES